MSWRDTWIDDNMNELKRLSAENKRLRVALREMLEAHSMENIGIDASLRRTRAKAQARDALKLTEEHRE